MNQQPLTDADLEAIRAANERRRQLKAETSPGPWVASVRWLVRPTAPGRFSYVARIHTREADTNFCAAAHEDTVEDRVDQLLAEVERLRQENAALAAMLEVRRDWLSPADVRGAVLAEREHVLASDQARFHMNAMFLSTWEYDLLEEVKETAAELEREACARAAEEHGRVRGWIFTHLDIAAAIRARGNPPCGTCSPSC